ncbi:MAG: 3-methyl-2-oxobutanoate hydroxymethyltransferase [Candidatus Zixiibacteriota bacterium]
MDNQNGRKKITVSSFVNKKSKGEKIAVLTAYDYYTAKFLDQAGADAILVGDSVGMVIYGHKTTHQMTMEIMLAHTKAVSSAVEKALVIGDMPFMSYQPSLKTAVKNAGRFISEAMAHTVKLEGGIEMADCIKRITECGIPVMGHIGMTPQSIFKFGGPAAPRVQGRNDESRNYLIESAQALETAGAYGIVLELVAKETAKEITNAIKIPTIGIGAGKNCDGQVLVTNDILGLVDDFQPKFVRRYADLAHTIEEAAGRYIKDVKEGNFPGDDECFT